MSWQGPLDPPPLYQRRLYVDVNPQPPRIVTEAKLTCNPAEHRRRATLCFTMCTTKGMNVCVHVFLRDSEKLCTIFQRGFHRKLQDQTRGAVPDAFSFSFFLRGALADGISRLEELTPSSLCRSNHRTALLEESGRACFGEARTSSSNHGTDRGRPDFNFASLRGRSRE